MSLSKRTDRMYEAVEARHENAWLIFAERLLSHLTRRDRRVMERLCVCDRRDELVSDFMGIFGADVEKWEEWTRELTAIKYDEGVSFWPSDAPLPPPEPEGLWGTYRRRSEKTCQRLRRRP